MADVNVGLLLTTTLKNYRTKLIDQIHKSSATYYLLKKNGAVREESGGERISEPLMYGKNTTAGSYSGYDSLDTTPQEGIDSAEFTWKQYSVSVTISGREERINAGNKYKLIDILDAKTQQAKLSLIEQMTTGLFSDGTGNSSKDLTGLAAMVAATGTYGGIDSSAYTWWQAGVDSSSEALSLSDMRTAVNTASVAGKDQPDLIVTTQTLFEKYESLFTQVAVASQAYATNWSTQSEGTKKVADGGFQSLSFKGIPITWDELCTSGAMYFLNTGHMKLVVHKDAYFEVGAFVKPENHDARIAQILFQGNLTCNRRKSFYLLSNKTA